MIFLLQSVVPTVLHMCYVLCVGYYRRRDDLIDSFDSIHSSRYEKIENTEGRLFCIGLVIKCCVPQYFVNDY